MIEIKTKLRRWGNSLGAVVPQKDAERSRIAEGDDVIIMLKKEKEGNILRETFGALKLKKPTREIMEGIDRDLDVDF